jgi:two-component system, NarL family, sensor kinase
MSNKKNKNLLSSLRSEEDFAFTERNFDLLLTKTAEQEEIIKSLEYSQEILSSLCTVTPYSVHIIEAMRNSKNEIIDLKILRVKCENEDFELEVISNNTEKDAIGKISDFFSEESHSQIIEKEYSSVDEKGKLHWFWSKQSTFKQTDEGMPQQVLLISQDITEKKIAAIALQENEHFLKSIADSSPDILYVVDLINEKIIYINNAIYDILKYTPDQIKNTEGSLIDLFFHPDDQEIVRNHFKSFQAESNPPSADMEYRMKDAFGEWHYMRCRHSAFKLDEHGFATQLLGIGQNVTDLKKYQEERIKVKLEQQRAISYAILKTQEEERKRIAEALHNSLGQILYGAKLSLAMLDSERKPSENSNLEIKKIVNDLLEEAIVETKTISFELMPAILKDFGLETAIKDLLNKKFQKIQLKSSIHLVGLKNRMDPDMEIAIFRIVQELINNSIKHAKAQKVDLHISKLSDYVNINLNDDGIGFNKEILNSKNKGFGLRNINNRVKVLNGNLVINTNSSKGTQINIDIPLEENEQ